MQPIIHLALILLVYCICLVLPRAAWIHILSFSGLAAVAIFAPVAAGFITIIVIEAFIIVICLRPVQRKSNWRKFGPYVLLLNIFFVDLHYSLLGMPVATLAISFSTIRIFMTVKQILNSRKEIRTSESYWIFVAAFYLPAIVIGPVFSGKIFRDQLNSAIATSITLRDYRLVLQGVVLVLLMSPMFGLFAETMSNVGLSVFPLEWGFLFLQLFAAFWGQSLIAEHTSRFFGFRLPVNFDNPWKAITIKDFWGRWHRSMAQFVLQYIFLPLSLNGVNPKLATILAFVFMGMWHNLTIGYLVWGLCHGALLAFDKSDPQSSQSILVTKLMLWIIVISLSWFANYGPLS